jgi:hypothetical protein
MGFSGSSGATLIVARGVIPTTTPDRFKQANHKVKNQGCKNGGDHRFFFSAHRLSLNGVLLGIPLGGKHEDAFWLCPPGKRCGGLSFARSLIPRTPVHKLSMASLVFVC